MGRKQYQYGYDKIGPLIVINLALKLVPVHQLILGLITAIHVAIRMLYFTSMCPYFFLVFAKNRRPLQMLYTDLKTAWN